MNQFVFWIFVVLATAVLGSLATFGTGAYHQTIIALAGINVILAVSLNLVNGFTGQFSMGHAGFMAVGAYVGAAVSYFLAPQFGSAWTEVGSVLSQVTMLGAVLAGGVVAGLIGVLVGIPSLRLKGDYLAIVTLGFGEIIRILILNIESIGGARGLYGIPQLANLYWIIGVAILSCVFIYRIVESIPGKQFMAVRDDETATLAMGLSTTRIKVRSFVMAAFFAGVAGALFAHYYAYLNPATFTFNYSFQVIAMVVLGGMGSLSGSISAAILLTVLLEALRTVQDYTGYDLRMVFYALILIIIMLTRPSGIFGRHEIWEFWKRRRAEGKSS